MGKNHKRGVSIDSGKSKWRNDVAGEVSGHIKALKFYPKHTQIGIRVYFFVAVFQSST